MFVFVFIIHFSKTDFFYISKYEIVFFLLLQIMENIISDNSECDNNSLSRVKITNNKRNSFSCSLNDLRSSNSKFSSSSSTTTSYSVSFFSYILFTYLVLSLTILPDIITIKKKLILKWEAFKYFFFLFLHDSIFIFKHMKLFILLSLIEHNI